MGRRPRSRTLATAAAVVAAVALAAAACGGDDAATTTSAPPAGDGPPSSAPPTTSNPTPGGVTGSTGSTEVVLTDVGIEVTSPVDLTTRPGSSSLLLAERAGTVREAVPDGDGFRLVDGAVLDLGERVGSTGGERGLLALAVSADGSELYVHYTEADRGDTRVDAYSLAGADGSLRADPRSRRELLAVEQPYPNHNGGSLLWGPDGNLWLGLGDGGAADDPEGRAQDRSTLLGKVVRLDPRTGGAPAGNPFVDGGGDPRIWATGLRNPWRMSFDPTSGDLWIGDVGQGDAEEVTVLRAADGWDPGANLGWDLFEGTARFDGADPAPPPASDGPFTDPLFTYPHDDGACSITGGRVVRDPRLGGLDGVYLYGDFCRPGVRGIRVAGGADGTTVDELELDGDLGSVVAFGEGPRRELFVLSLDGPVRRIDPA